MRIIAGTLKSRKLKMVPSDDTRETSDKVRGAVFNSLGPVTYDGTILDLFAGSGSYGLEAISRGAKLVVFNDNKQIAINTLKDNIQSLGVNSMTNVWKLDYQNALSKIVQMDTKFDVVFLDPPYKLDIYESIVNQLYDYLNEDAKIVLEMDKERTIQVDKILNFKIDKEKVYGSKK